jgi:hypothetical protein
LDICKKYRTFAPFFAKRRRHNIIFKLKKTILSMKKMLLIVAVAFAAMACGNKCDKKCCEAEAEAPAAEAVEAPAEEEAAPAEEQTLIERAVELGEDVAAEAQK